LFLEFNARKSAILTNFCNPEIPGLKRRQSRDSGLAKTAWIPGFEIAISIPAAVVLQFNNHSYHFSRHNLPQHDFGQPDE